MKGILKKTKEGWFVVFNQRTMQDPSAEDGVLPLEPEMANYLDMNLTSTTYEKEKEFEEIELVDRINQSGIYIFKKYAKLVEPKRNFVFSDDHIVQSNEMVEEHKQEILIPVIPNVDCRDGKEIGVWMEGWLQGYKEAQVQYEAKETLYTKEDLCESFHAHNDTWIDYEEWFKQFKK